MCFSSGCGNYLSKVPGGWEGRAGGSWDAGGEGWGPTKTGLGSEWEGGNGTVEGKGTRERGEGKTIADEEGKGGGRYE